MTPSILNIDKNRYIRQNPCIEATGSGLEIQGDNYGCSNTHGQNNADGGAARIHIRPRTLDKWSGSSTSSAKINCSTGRSRANKLSSLIFYGPRALGKTTLARVIANTTKSEFTGSMRPSPGKGYGGSREGGEGEPWHVREGTILFIDEIHRF